MIFKTFETWLSYKADMIARTATATLQYELLDVGVAEERYVLTWIDGVITANYVMVKADETTVDYDDFVNNYKTLANQSLQLQAAVVKQELDSAKSLFTCSHNFADKTTWWFGSIKITDEILTGANTAWSAANDSIIDLEHGKYMFENTLLGTGDSIKGITPALWAEDPRVVAKFPSGHHLIPTLKDYQGTLLTRVDTSPATGEWSIDYKTGAVTTGDNWVTNAPKLSYHYGLDSVFEFWVDSGKQLLIHKTEVNSMNANFGSTIALFDVLMDHPSLGLGTVVNRRGYKSLADIINASTGAPSEWVDASGNKWTVFPWPYADAEAVIEDSRIVINSSTNMKIRICLKNNTPYAPVPGQTDAMVNITLYAVSRTEV